jgi:hypothetical protein
LNRCPSAIGSKLFDAACFHFARANLDTVLRHALQFAFLMRPIPHKRKEGQSFLRTMLAVFFTIFMLSDLCCMSSCAGELDELRGLGAARFDAGSTGQPTPAISTADTEQGHDSKSENDDDGCFCSGHILQALTIDMAHPEVSSEVGDSPEIALPTSPPQPLFPPPRFI